MKKWWNIFLFILFVAGCSEELDFDPLPADPVLVVDAVMTTDTAVHYVKLSKSSGIGSPGPGPSVTGAMVSVTDNLGHEIVLRESDTLPGLYLTASQYHALPGRTYRLDIRLNKPVNGQDHYFAVSEVYEMGPVDSIKLKHHSNWGAGGYCEVMVYYQDPPGRDYYMSNILLNGTLVTDSLTERIVVDDRFFDGGYTHGIGAAFLDQSDPGEKLSPGDTIMLQAARIDEAYAQFIWDVQKENGINNPFYGGMAGNATTNLSGGAIGFFAVYSVSYSSVTAD